MSDITPAHSRPSRVLFLCTHNSSLARNPSVSLEQLYAAGQAEEQQG